jgi:hypothetical protein
MTRQAVSILLCVILVNLCADAQQSKRTLFPVRGFAIAAPTPTVLDSFITFIDSELAPREVNTLVLRVDYKYQFKSHPELIDSGALSQEQVKMLVAACKRNNIHLIPQINLLGHQSWANRPGKLLQVYPQFDETPQVVIPEQYQWPNADSLYCKSYCPLHPEVHNVIFDLVDEICDVFESDAFHAGMDEVFYIGHDNCVRCSGKNKAELFAGEVTTISKHLNLKRRKLWIWGDRLLDGKATGVGMWEGSMNNTHHAITMIPKGVVICDWHYERPDKTPVHFAKNGLTVITCSWRKPEVAVAQVNDMVSLRKQSRGAMKNRYAGVMETVWSSVSVFLNGYYGKDATTGADNGQSPWNCFRAMFEHIDKISKSNEVVTR